MTNPKILPNQTLYNLGLYLSRLLLILSNIPNVHFHNSDKMDKSKFPIMDLIFADDNQLSLINKFDDNQLLFP